MKRITAKRIATLPAGRYHDGGAGLSLLVKRTGARSWVQRLTVRGRRVDRGLGGYPFVSLAQAREWAVENWLTAKRGGDPFRESRRAAMLSLGDCARLAFDASPLKGRNQAARESAMARHCGPLLGQPVDAIGRPEIVALLAPLTESRPVLGRQIRGWLAAAFAQAMAKGLIASNPADGLAAVLPKRQTVEHRSALPYGEIGAALARLDASAASPSVKGLIRFQCATAVRPGEARGAVWSEVDLDAATWTIPAARMKGKVEHRVPLSDAALDVLRAAPPGRRATDGPIFVGARGRGLGPTTALRAWQTVNPGSTLHGARSCFRDWCSERSSASHAVCEKALAHAVGSSVERSYARSDLYERRASLMREWGAFLAQ